MPETYSGRSDPRLVTLLQGGAVGVLKTDTLYGLVTSATKEAAVKRVYRVRNRSPEKPCIILLADTNQLLSTLPADLEAVIHQYWPGPVSIIVPVDNTVPAWLHRGTHTLAYRVPADKELQALLAATGPLLAPSANPQGLPPARSIKEARHYFGDAVDFYADSGDTSQHMQPSRLVRLHPDGSADTLR